MCPRQTSHMLCSAAVTQAELLMAMTYRPPDMYAVLAMHILHLSDTGLFYVRRYQTPARQLPGCSGVEPRAQLPCTPLLATPLGPILIAHRITGSERVSSAADEGRNAPYAPAVDANAAAVVMPMPRPLSHQPALSGAGRLRQPSITTPSLPPTPQQRNDLVHALQHTARGLVSLQSESNM